MHKLHFGVHRKVCLWVVLVVGTLLLGAIAVAARAGIVAAQGPQPLKPQVALGTGFTYQGQLKKNNVPVNDNNCSMIFSLWNSPSGGAPVGSDQNIIPVTVTNGLFTVVLNDLGQFGPSAFDGSARWLQTAVLCAGDAGTLSRQQLTAAPYALFSAAPWVTSGSNLIYNAGNVGIGAVTPLAKLDVSSTSNNVGNNTAVFDDVTLGPNASNIHYGIKGDWYIRSAANDGKVILQDTGGNVGIGTTIPSHKLSVDGGADFSGNVGIGTASPNAKLEVKVLDSNYGVLSHTTTGVGVDGISDSGIGVGGVSTSGSGVYGQSASGQAGLFYGPVQVNGPMTVTGYLAKSGGGFLIDHPLDPANQYLNHSFVESPDMKNIYDGNMTLDASGEATVILPDYFEALNRDFRYQLTAIGAPGPNLYIAEEIQNNRFKIAGGKAGAKVSWQVTGIRHDPWAEQNRRPAEMDKAGQERGKYMYPQGYGQPDSMAVYYDKRYALERPALADLISR